MVSIRWVRALRQLLGLPADNVGMRVPFASSAAFLAAFATSCGPSGTMDLKRHEAVSSDALTVCAGGTTLQGLDVSVYQGSIDWGAAAGAGIAWSYAKATEGTGYNDPTFSANWSGMAAHGVARGAYHFFHPDLDGTQQADFFLNAVGSLGEGDLPPMLDWEVSDRASTGTAAANAQAFINEVAARTGKATVIYTSPGIWSGFGTPGGFGSDALWVADWGPSCPSLPGGWGSWVFWQYSDSGSVPGVPATVDRDVFNGDAAALSALAGGSATCSNPIALGHGIGTAGPVSGPCGGSAPVPTAPAGCGSIPAGDGLTMGQSVTSCDGRFMLVMQGDGNLVEYVHGNPLFSTSTNGQAAALVMQGDGNLVLYSSQGCPVWDTNTAGHSGASLAVQGDGNLVIYDVGGTPIWSSGTGPIGAKVTGCGAMAPGTGLAKGDSVEACGGCFTFVMQGDGNLVLYQTHGGAVWNSGTAGTTADTVVMQGDGNLVIYSTAGCPLWNSGSGGHPGASLAVQDDGNLVIYDPGGGVAWNAASVACAGGCTCNAPAATSSSSTATSTSTSTATSTSTSTATSTSTSTATSTSTSTSSSSGGPSSTSSGGTHGASTTSRAGTSTGGSSTSGESTGRGSSSGAVGSIGTGSSGSHSTSEAGSSAGRGAPQGGCGSTRGSDTGALAALLMALVGTRRRSTVR
jgi:GH25 family lysozyme M1 (1,4-beta-N-acetylmuramidase)